MGASIYGHANIVHELLEAHADVNRISEVPFVGTYQCDYRKLL